MKIDKKIILIIVNRISTIRLQNLYYLSRKSFIEFMEIAKDGMMSTDRLADIVGRVSPEQEKMLCKAFIENNRRFFVNKSFQYYIPYLIQKSYIFSEIVLSEFSKFKTYVQKESVGALTTQLIKPICSHYPDMVRKKVNEKKLPRKFLFFARNEAS